MAECVKCNKELASAIISECQLLCPNKPLVNTSGKVTQLFFIDGDGFSIEPINFLSSKDTP